MKKFVYIICLYLLFAASAGAQGINEAIDLTGFWDSAHHWYDINDEEKVIYPLDGHPVYNPGETEKIADNIVLFQKDNGGWAKNYDMRAILNEEQKEKVRKSKAELNTTFDNGATHSQVLYLAKAFTRTGNEVYREACIKGLNFILNAQYENGGWPQYFPDTSGYRKYITFNDGAMMGVMNVLSDIVTGRPWFSFADNDLRDRSKKAFDKGIRCILNSQIKDNGKLTVWCQQHDNITLLPQDARTFELASICNGESAEIVLFLMKIENPSGEIINSIQSAVNWFNESKITGIRVETIASTDTSFMYHDSQDDKIVVKDSAAPPIWPRFTELETHRPLFCNRDGQPVYSLAEVDRERRTGYAWYIYSPQEVLDKYNKAVKN